MAGEATRKRLWNVLRSIPVPGIGPRLAALFLALVGDLDRFPSPKAITAFAGLDVTLYYQSGRFAGRRCLSKRGDPLLRHVLYLMAVALKRYTRRFARLYAHYREQGCAVRETLVILSRKVLHMLFHLLRHGRLFQDDPPSKKAFAL